MRSFEILRKRMGSVRPANQNLLSTGEKSVA